ncbi:MAG: TSUP family transporter, partial [Arenicellales bacterium]
MYFEIADITVSIWLLLVWGVLVGFVFSTVGAAGGILASVGLISVFGIQDPNLVKPMAQSLTLVTPLIAVPLYIRQCRMVTSLALLLGLGGVLGAMLGSYLSLNYLSDMSVFKPVFAGLIFLIAGQIAWQLWHGRGTVSERTKSVRAAELFQIHMQGGGKSCEVGVRKVNATRGRITIEFGEEKFSFNPLLPFLSGVAIAVMSSALGVGGGFLLVPF